MTTSTPIDPIRRDPASTTEAARPTTPPPVVGNDTTRRANDATRPTHDATKQGGGESRRADGQNAGATAMPHGERAPARGADARRDDASDARGADGQRDDASDARGDGASSRQGGTTAVLHSLIRCFEQLVREIPRGSAASLGGVTDELKKARASLDARSNDVRATTASSHVSDTKTPANDARGSAPVAPSTSLPRAAIAGEMPSAVPATPPSF